jgi:hypothetical protein
MIKLEDRVNIHTTQESLFKWLKAMPDEYAHWHPDHVSCRLLKGTMLDVGAEVEIREYLHGKLHTMRMRLTRVYPGRRVEYEVIGLGTGAFAAAPASQGILFTAELAVGADLPVLGMLVDAVLRLLFAGRLSAMRQHMVEEGLNLKRILESGWEPPCA